MGLEASDALNGCRAIGRYARELPPALLAAARPGEIDLRLLLFGRRCRRRAAPFLASLGANGDARARVVPLPARAFHGIWNRSGLVPLEWLLGRLDVVHALSFLTPPARASARTILTMHGIVNFVRPDLLEPAFVEELRGRWDFYLRRADWLVSVSEASRREFLERFDFPPERVRAIPLGVSKEFQPLDREELDRRLADRFGPQGIERPYVLFVGGLQRVKNVAGLLTAFRILLEKRRVPHQLVLAGVACDGMEEAQRALRDPALAGRVRFTGHLPQSGDALTVLYGGAEALVQPSFYEGWASPPLEAMACGTPVVAASIPSLRESCGEAALYADPGEPGAIADALERALTDDALRAELRRRGLARSGEWSWLRCARETLELYRDAAAAGPRPSPRRVERREASNFSELYSTEMAPLSSAPCLDSSPARSVASSLPASGSLPSSSRAPAYSAPSSPTSSASASR